MAWSFGPFPGWRGKLLGIFLLALGAAVFVFMVHQVLLAVDWCVKTADGGPAAFVEAGLHWLGDGVSLVVLNAIGLLATVFYLLLASAVFYVLERVYLWCRGLLRKTS